MSEKQNQTFCILAVSEAYILIKEQGSKGLSMRKLAKCMECSTQKLYSNFKNKNELILAIATHLRTRIQNHHLAVKKNKNPLQYLLDLTFKTLQFFVNEPSALEVLMEQRYQLDLNGPETLEDPYCIALQTLNCPGLSEKKSFKLAINSIRLLIVGASYSLYKASDTQRKEIFKGIEYALCNMLQGWGYKMKEEVFTDTTFDV